MAYLDDDLEGFDDESSSLLLESDDTGTWGPSPSEEAIGPRYRPNFARSGPTRVPRPTPPRPVGGLGGATLNTPAGRAQMRFEKPLATKESVDASIKEIKRDMLALAETVKKVDQTVDKNTAILDKKLLALEAIQKKASQGGQMGMLLPLLLNKPPEIDTLKAKATPTGPVVTLSVSETKYKSTDNLGLLIAIMAMSGGMGGGGDGGGDSMNMMLVALALSGSLGGSK